MSSSRLARLRNQAGSGNPLPPPQQQQRQNQYQNQSQPRQNGNVNPMQILQWHETRLKDLLQRFEYLDAKTQSLAESNANPTNNSNTDANNLIVVNDILDRINKLSQRVDAVEVLTRNLKDDYLTYKNGTTENKVELVVSDTKARINEIKKTENVVQETKAEVKEIQEALQKLQIEPTHADVKKVTFEAPVARGEPMGFDGGSMDLTGSAI